MKDRKHYRNQVTAAVLAAATLFTGVVPVAFCDPTTDTSATAPAAPDQSTPVVRASAALDPNAPFAPAAPPAPAAADENLPVGILHEVDVTDVPLREALDVIASASGMNLAASEDAAKTRVSLRLHNVTPFDAVQTLCQTHGLFFKQRRGWWQFAEFVEQRRRRFRKPQVTLRLIQETSSVVTGGATIPIIGSNGTVTNQPVDVVSATTLTGTLIAKDGLSLALGGLITEDVSDTRQGVPIGPPGLPLQRQAARGNRTQRASVIAAAMALLAMLMLSSCSTAPTNSTATTPQTGAPLALPAPSPEHVSIDSRWACSGSEHRPSTGELLDLARAQVSAGAGGPGLDHQVRQWPDVTLDLLRSSASSPGDNQPILFAIASAYDRAFGTEEPAAGWCTVLSVADSGASPYLQFHQARAATLEQFTAGKIDGAARVDLTATLPPDAPKALRAEAFRLAGSTLPVLDVLMKTPDPRIAARASVIEGDLWCRVLNDRARGIPMMRDGLDQSDAGNWPGKDRFTANLALYCILEGKDDEGVRLLHQAQTRFQAAGRWDDLANSLKNEAGYLQLIGKTEQAAAAQKRADEASRRAGHAQL